MEFERLMADFGEAAGIDARPDAQGTVWIDSDGVMVTVQHRPEHDDMVIFSLPLSGEAADETIMRRALELSSAGLGTGGFYIGLHDGYLTLSAVIPLEGLDAEAFAKRLLALSSATTRVTNSITASVAEASAARYEAQKSREESGGQFVFRV